MLDNACKVSLCLLTANVIKYHILQNIYLHIFVSNKMFSGFYFSTCYSFKHYISKFQTLIMTFHNLVGVRSSFLAKIAFLPNKKCHTINVHDLKRPCVATRSAAFVSIVFLISCSMSIVTLGCLCFV